jgi:hypothetical protein
MIKDRQKKIEEIIYTIKNRIHEINERYRNGPDLYFYKRLLALRRQTSDIIAFLNNDYNLEIIYATLVSWDMNSRGAKLKYFDEFKSSILSCMDSLNAINGMSDIKSIDILDLQIQLLGVYKKLSLMKTKGRLVSNSKFLHFLFPDLFVPMDRKNTLEYFYGNTNESVNKFFEITEFSFDLVKKLLDDNVQLDEGWNSTIPKTIDNAIILIVGKSVD